jgi:hypothetical protein
MLVTLFCFCLFTNIDAGKRKGKMKWTKAEKEVGGTTFSEVFKDSLQNVYNIETFSGLRELPENRLGLKKGEKLVYDAGWGFLRAGFAILDTKIRDSTIRIEGKAVTNNFVSTIFKVRDYASVIIDLKGLYPCFFEQHIKETKYKTTLEGNKTVVKEKVYERHNWTIFDHVKGKVYSSRKKEKTEYDISPFTHSYLSLLYYLRTKKFAPGDTFSIHCFVHGKDYPIKFKVHGREKIKVKAGTFKCIKVQPILVGEGTGFTKKDLMYLWFTDDKHHMMVKGKSKVALGWISVNLLRYERK